MKTQKLFSKRDKSNKYTTMGVDLEDEKGILGVPQNNKTINSKTKEELEEDEENKKYENEFKSQKNVIEKVSNTTLKNSNNLEELQKKTLNLQEKLQKLKQELIKERNEFVKDINKNDTDLNQKTLKLKKLSNKYNKNIESLKTIEQSLTEKENKYKKKKGKTVEQIKKEISTIDSQIKIYQDRASLEKENYNLSVKRAEKKENLENDLKEELIGLNEEISELKNTINDLRKIDIVHKHCKYNNKKLIEEFKSINDAYQFELKRAKQLALSEIYEENNEDNKNNEMGEEEEDEDDNAEKAIEDEKNFLPKIQSIQFTEDPENKLETKIIRRNKIGLRNNKSDNVNAINLFKRASNEFYNNNRYIIEANKNIRLNNKNRINNSSINMKTDGNCLFREYESKILRKILPENLYNSCQNRYNNLYIEKKDIEDKIKNETKEINYENSSIINQREFISLKIREINQKRIILNKKYHTILEKINIIKKEIKEAEKQVEKEDKKMKNCIRKIQQIQICYEASTNNQQKNNKNKRVSHEN